MLSEITKRIKFWKGADRIGPDIPYTHWKLHFKSTMLKLCKSKFKFFDDTAEFRPGSYAVVCSKISIGRKVAIHPGTMLFADPREGGAGITIEDDVLVGSAVHIYVTDHKFDDTDSSIIEQGYSGSREVVLKKGCWIGAKSVILPGVTIGKNSVVGAGSIVTKDVPDGVVAVGNPARVIKEIGVK